MHQLVSDYIKVDCIVAFHFYHLPLASQHPLGMSGVTLLFSSVNTCVATLMIGLAYFSDIVAARVQMIGSLKQTRSKFECHSLADAATPYIAGQRVGSWESGVGANREALLS